MNAAFVTFLGTEDFLPGVLALKNSLFCFNNKFPLVIMVTSDISENTIQMLRLLDSQIVIVDHIKNPYHSSDDPRGFNHMYTKLRVFELVTYDKLVYLDSDMIVCNNIEELFTLPSMSAVAAGSLLARNASWTNLNAGFLVIEPSIELFSRMIFSVDKLKSKDGSDQGFLHSFFPEWQTETILHADHRYNVPFTYLNEYCNNFNFNFSYIRKKLETNISILHFWGEIKPWHYHIGNVPRQNATVDLQAMFLWHDQFKQASRKANIELNLLEINNEKYC
jgi:lipopolysaccharide biosynthesis glycosyltransferase